jgi:hypothetical protein
MFFCCDFKYIQTAFQLPLVGINQRRLISGAKLEKGTTTFHIPTVQLTRNILTEFQTYDVDVKQA